MNGADSGPRNIYSQRLKSRRAGRIGTQGANVHFEDRVEAGRISFDYRMLPGVVERSNAIELMRSVGLGV